MTSFTVTRRPFYLLISPVRTVTNAISSGYSKTYPVTSGLRNIFTDLLGRKTEWTNLGSEGRLGTDFTTSGPKVTIERAIVSTFDCTGAR